MPEDPAESSAALESTNPRNAGAKRKRGVGPTSRSVASLTAEQLEKKRKNDRDAQRAIRERTKGHIDRLNDRIRELEQADPYQQLQGVIRQKEIIQSENDDLKRKMNQVVTLLQPNTNSSRNLNDLASAAAERNSAPLASPLPPIHSPYISAPAPVNAASPVQSIPSPASAVSIPRSYGTVSVGNVPQWGSPAPSIPEIDYSADPNPDIGYVLDQNNRFVRGMYNIRYTHYQPALPPVYSMLPRVYEKGPLDTLMMDFLAKTQRLAASGVPLKELAGPAYPNWNTMLNPDSRHSAHLLSKVFTDILHTFPDVDKLPEQIAVVFIMFLVMRWQVEPTKENYDRLPEWMRPRPEQLFISHPHWLDYIPWPLLRSATIQKKPHVEFENFFVSYTISLSINWPYSNESCLIPNPLLSSQSLGGQGEEPIYSLSPVYEAHMRELGNWSLGPEFRDTFPDWGSCVRIKQH